MPSTKRIVCLANSYKPPKGRCFAGRELLADGAFGPWIRPISARATAEVSFAEYKYKNNTTPKLLDIIDIPMLKAVPHNHQTENYLLDPKQWWTKSAEFPWDHLEKICEGPESIWINNDSTGQGIFDCVSAAEAATLDSSLMLIKPASFTVQIGTSVWDGVAKKTYRADFEYKKTHYNFSLTDPRARDVYSKEGSYQLKNVYLCISLTELFDRDNRCHKLVAAILQNPAL